MVNPYWESVCRLINQGSNALVSGVEMTAFQKDAERSDFNYRLSDNYNQKAFTQIVKAARWALNSGIFQECHFALTLIVEEGRKIKEQYTRNTIKARRNRRPRPSNAVPKKTAFCEESILEEIWNYEYRPQKPKTGFNPKIGIELECEDAPRMCPHPDWDHRSDGSLSRNGREYVSAPVALEDGLVQFRQVVSTVKRHGAIGDSDCGLHVHIGMDPSLRPDNPWTDDELREKEAAILEYINSKRNCPDHNLIFTRKRYEGTYCRPRPNEDHCRYSAVNFHSLSKHGTIEIRFFAVCPDLSDEWIEQFERTIRHFYSIITGDGQFRNPNPYQGPITFSFEDRWVNSDYCEKYWSNWDNVTAHLANL